MYKCPNRRRQSHCLCGHMSNVSCAIGVFENRMRKIWGTDIHRGHGGSIPLIRREQRQGFQLGSMLFFSAYPKIREGEDGEMYVQM